jgi:hypothetical protein
MRTAFDILLVLALCILLWLYSRLIAYYDGQPRKPASGPAFGVFACHRPEPDVFERRGTREQPKDAAASATSQGRQSEAVPHG